MQGKSSAESDLPSHDGMPIGHMQEARIRHLENGHHMLAAQIASIALNQEAIDQRVGRLEKGQGDILTELQANTAITSDIKDLMEAARGTKKFAGWAKQGLVYVAAVLGAVVGIYGALYALTHGGKLP